MSVGDGGGGGGCWMGLNPDSLLFKTIIAL